MKQKAYDLERQWPKSRMAYVMMVSLAMLVLSTIPLLAQVKYAVQVKAFDHELRPFKNAEVSINGKEYIRTNDKGVVFTELEDSDLPVKSIKIKNDQLEAASWNYSKGILEIVIRKKSYQLVQVVVRDVNNVAIGNLKVVFNGRKTITSTTSATGRFEMPLALDETMTATQFTIVEYNAISLHPSGKEWTLIIAPVAKEEVAEAVIPEKPKAAEELFRDFDLSKLDSIQSLTVFYAVFKNISMKDLSPSAKERVDAKFDQLVRQLEDPVKGNDVEFIGKISDSSFVSDDIRNLLQQATLESQTLDAQRDDFDEKIRIINEKMAAGVGNLDAETRSRLISDITRLEMILSRNESRFYKNQNDYRQLINALKEKFFELEDLENKLSASEAQRLEEQRVFRERLLIIGSIVILFAFLIVMLVWFGSKLRKQKIELERVNNEINSINENLEGLVLERTKLLEAAHRELDTFLYRASHDLRSPVCSIIGLCNLASHFSSGEARDILDRVTSTTSAMDRLLKKLQIISEINQPSNFSVINVRELVDHVVYAHQDIARKHNIRMTVNCVSPLIIYSYPSLIEAILTNLVENALFYTSVKNQHDGKIEVSAAIVDDHLHLTLVDNGIGIDNTIRDRIFDMFFKGHVVSKGNGLGLYIVQKSVHALEGNVAMESVPDQYTKFVVWIPIEKDIHPELSIGSEAQNVMASQM